jgi:hypothetical protein
MFVINSYLNLRNHLTFNHVEKDSINSLLITKNLTIELIPVHCLKLQIIELIFLKRHKSNIDDIWLLFFFHPCLIDNRWTKGVTIL